MSQDPFRDVAYADFEAMGESAVREKVKVGHISGKKRRYAEAWLGDLDAKAQSRTHEREEESLSISRKALKTSEQANSIAEIANKASRNANIWAAIAALLSAIAMAIAFFALAK